MDVPIGGQVEVPTPLRVVSVRGARGLGGDGDSANCHCTAQGVPLKSARNFRRLVAEQKALWRKDNHRGRRPAVWSPGEYVVIDWAEVAPGLFVFCAVLAFSRWRFVRFATDQKASTTLAMIADALAAI